MNRRTLFKILSFGLIGTAIAPETILPAKASLPKLRETRYPGIVVDNRDPLKLGRLKIRIHGLDDLTKDEELPWISYKRNDVLPVKYKLPENNEYIYLRELECKGVPVPSRIWLSCPKQ